MKIFKTLFLVAALAIACSSCETPKLGYFQDVKSGDSFEVSKPEFVKLQAGDRLSVLVSSRDPNLAYLFNLPIVAHYRPLADQSLNSNQVASYTVDQNGNIDFPVLGEIHVAGMTRKDLSTHIKKTLINRQMLKDPMVTVDFIDMTYGVLGEVKNPGRYGFDRDRITLLDAISRAGDLTINGVRENLLVCRDENGKQTYYRVDLTKADQIYSSPVFYLKPNDIIYVEPNLKKEKEATEFGNSFMQPSLWISAASLLTTILVLIIK